MCLNLASDAMVWTQEIHDYEHPPHHMIDAADVATRQRHD